MPTSTKPKPQPKPAPQPSAKDEARRALQMSMDRHQ